MNITTIVLSSLRNRTCQVAEVKFNENIHPMVFLMNLHVELKKADMSALWFGELVDSLYTPDATEFYSNIRRGGKNLFDMPLGYDGLSHTMMFVNTMIGIKDAIKIDLTNCVMPEIKCITVDGAPRIDYDRGGVDGDYSELYYTPVSHYHIHLLRKYKPERDSAVEAEDKVAYKKVSDEIKHAKTIVSEMVESKPDGVEFDVNGVKYVKGVPVTLEMMIEHFYLGDAE